MEQRIPLIPEEGCSSPTEDSEFFAVEMEKIPPESLPRWYRLPAWRIAPSWDGPSTWRSWSREDIPDVKTTSFVIFGYLLTILPRFLRPEGWKQRDNLHPTAYLDALRGWAAACVFRSHTFENRTEFLEWPVIRAAMNGRAMVDIFFVISGYVLSYRLLKMMRNQQPNFMRVLASSTFRRWFRLYMSTGIATLTTAMAVHLGWCKWWLRQDTILAQLGDWLWDWGASSNPFGDIRGAWSPAGFRSKYLEQMWTIPVEFLGSLLVFWFCATSAYLSTRGRRLFCCAVILLCYYWAVVYGALFLFGVLIADLSFDRHPERLHGVRLPQQQDGGEQAAPKPKQAPLVKAGWVMLLIVALFLLGQPWPPADVFLWRHLDKAVPSWYPGEIGEHFFLSFGAALLVFTLDNCRMLQLPFEWRFSQYLGDISFGIYAMHNTVNWVLYMRIVDPWRQIHLGPSYWAGLPGILVTTLVVLWVSDYFTRLDDWVVWFGRWWENKAFIKWQD